MVNGTETEAPSWMDGGSWSTQSMARPPGNPGHEETTRSGIPIRLIWVPYLVLTLIIISLMIMSFIRFHFKHGHKYLRRREELMLRHSQNQAAAAAVAIATDTLPPNGGPNLTVTIDPTPIAIPTAPVMAPNHNLINHHRNGQKLGRANHSALNHRSLPPPHKISSAKHTVSSSGVIKKTSRPRRHRPIAFARNANGSMVDLRVAGVDSVSMFRSSFQTVTRRPGPVHWSGVRPPPYRTLSSPGSGLSEDEDDHVLLIHQSKV